MAVSSLDEPLIPADGDLYVKVTAPARLEAGYSIQVEISGQDYHVMVPSGGVEEGQKFYANLSKIKSASPGPRGAWRDGIFDCTRFGYCHPVCCLGFWCCPILLSQVMTRMKLNFCGGRGGNHKRTATIIAALTTGVYFARLLLNRLTVLVLWVGEDVLHKDDSPAVIAINSTDICLEGSMLLFLIFLTIRTRKFVREKYGIPNQCCGMGDCCSSLLCGWCTVAQMARHTTDYDVYNATCFSETGVSPLVPAIIT